MCDLTSISVVLAVICVTWTISPATAGFTRDDKRWDQRLFNYSKNQPPRSDTPTEVKIGIYINSFFSINEASMDYSISFYLRQEWNDPRLAIDPTKSLEDSLEIKLHDSAWEEIWLPDIFFRNEKTAALHEMVKSNRLLMLKPNGTVWYVLKITATLACPMFLNRYPMDTQSCPIQFESFGYRKDILYFSWLDEPIEVDPNNQIPQFSLIDKKRSDCSQNYTKGSFGCLEVNFILQRDIGFFVLQVYIPSMLVVIISWVNFWINAEAVPARVSIGLITVLTVTTQSTTVNASLPKVSYVKAIDVWMSMCLLFVFAALLEYAFVNFLCQKKDKRENALQSAMPQPVGEADAEQKTQMGPGNGEPESTSKSNGSKPVDKPSNSGWVKVTRSISLYWHWYQRQGEDYLKTTILFQIIWGPIVMNHFYIPALRYNDDPCKQAKIQAKVLDRFCRIFFPLVFVIFNIVYWLMFHKKATVTF